MCDASLPPCLRKTTRSTSATWDPRRRWPSEELRSRAFQTRCTTKSCLSITFDDGPYQWERKLVDTLGNAGGQKGTFLRQRQQLPRIYEDAQVQNLRYTYERGHQICSHTWGHPDISTLNNAQLDQQVQLVEDALWKILVSFRLASVRHMVTSDPTRSSTSTTDGATSS